MKITLTGAGSFRVGTVLCLKNVEATVDDAAYNKLSANAKALFSVGIGTPAKANALGQVRYWKALISQTGTNAPAATVSKNSLGGEIVWTYSEAGVYIGTLYNGFPVGTEFRLPQVPCAYESTVLSVRRLTAHTIELSSATVGGNADNGLITSQPVEIITPE